MSEAPSKPTTVQLFGYDRADDKEPHDLEGVQSRHGTSGSRRFLIGQAHEADSSPRARSVVFELQTPLSLYAGGKGKGLEVLAEEFAEERLRRITPAIAGASGLARSGEHATWTWAGSVGLRAASGA